MNVIYHNQVKNNELGQRRAWKTSWGHHWVGEFSDHLLRSSLGLESVAHSPLRITFA